MPLKAGLRSASAHLLVHEHECHGRGHVAHRVGHRAHHLSGRTVNRPSAARERIGAPCVRFCRRISTQPHAKQQPTSARARALRALRAPPLVLHPRLPPDKPAHDHTHTYLPIGERTKPINRRHRPASQPPHSLSPPHARARSPGEPSPARAPPTSPPAPRPPAASPAAAPAAPAQPRRAGGGQPPVPWRHIVEGADSVTTIIKHDSHNLFVLWLTFTHHGPDIRVPNGRYIPVEG